jgi:hypothetical protein
MARIPKVEYKVNLTDLFGERLDLTEATKEAIGQAIIDKIINRTQDNLDKNNNSLGTYSSSYKDSPDFKILKGNKSLVDLTATGDMLGNIDIIKITPQTIVFGFPDGTQNTKAYGHISGMKGHPVLDGKVQKRDFFGLPNEDLDKIADEFRDDAEQVDRINNAQTREDLDREVLSLIDELNIESREAIADFEEG